MADKVLGMRGSVYRPWNFSVSMIEPGGVYITVHVFWPSPSQTIWKHRIASSESVEWLTWLAITEANALEPARVVSVRCYWKQPVHPGRGQCIKVIT